MENSKKLIIIDSNSVLHRAFHALPPLINKKGEQTGAIYGFLLTFFKAIKELKPYFIAACFDTPGPTFRHKKFKAYKANRPKMPDELAKQFFKIKEVLKAFNVSIFEKQGFEGDDLIATINKLAGKKQIHPNLEIYILSGDSDIFQLISNNTKVYTLQKGIKKTIIYDRKEILSRFEIKPSQVVDFKALCGDPSDNIPGVTGIGKKTAVKLLSKFDNLENIYKEIEKKSQKSKNLNQKLQELLLKYKEQAFFSKYLASVRDNVPIDFKLETLQWENFDRKKVFEIFKDYGFHSLIKRLSEIDSQKEFASISQQKLNLF